MAKATEYCKWIGQSGLRYTYIVLELPAKLQTGQEGNYIFAKQNAEGKWVPVFIGHGDLAVACTAFNPQWEGILSHGATHFHCHLNAQPQARRDEEDDLLSRYKNAFVPYGCNTLPTHNKPAEGSSLTGLTDLDIELSSLEKQADSFPDLSALNPPDDPNDKSGTQPRP